MWTASRFCSAATSICADGKSSWAASFAARASSMPSFSWPACVSWCIAADCADVANGADCEHGGLLARHIVFNSRATLTTASVSLDLTVLLAAKLVLAADPWLCSLVLSAMFASPDQSTTGLRLSGMPCTSAVESSVVCWLVGGSWATPPELIAAEDFSALVSIVSPWHAWRTINFVSNSVKSGDDLQASGIRPIEARSY